MNAAVVNQSIPFVSCQFIPSTVWCIHPHMVISILVCREDFLTIQHQSQSTLFASRVVAWPLPERYQPRQPRYYSVPRHRLKSDPESDLTLLKHSQSQGGMSSDVLVQTSYCWNQRSSDPTSGMRMRIRWGGGRSSRRMVDWGSMCRQRRGRWRSEKR